MLKGDFLSSPDPYIFKEKSERRYFGNFWKVLNLRVKSQEKLSPLKALTVQINERFLEVWIFKSESR